MCGAEPINCFPVLVNILSNSFLRLFNSTARIRIWSNPLSFVSILRLLLKMTPDSQAGVMRAGWVEASPAGQSLGSFSAVNTRPI